MDFETFKIKYLFEDKIYGQVFYQIEEESSSIDFKLFSYGDEYKAVCFFRKGYPLENPNSVEIKLNSYNVKFECSPEETENILIKEMKKLFVDDYYYNVDNNFFNFKVSIVILPEEIKNASDTLSKVLSIKINRFLNSDDYINKIKKKYEIYSKFNELMNVYNDSFYLNNKVFFILSRNFVGEIFSLYNNSFTYNFKLISSPKLQILITFDASSSNENPNDIEKELMDIIRDESTSYFFNRTLKECINKKMSYILKSQKYSFRLVDNDIKEYGKISFVADLNQMDFTDVLDIFAYIIREKLLDFDVPMDYFKYLDEGWVNYKKSKQNKLKFQKIVGKYDYQELNYKLFHLFFNDFNNKSFLDIGNNTFSVVKVLKDRILIKTKLNKNNKNLIFKVNMDILYEFYDMSFRKEFFFKQSKYRGKSEAGYLIIEMFYFNIYEYDDKLERSLRDKLIESGLINNEYLSKLDLIWKNKLKKDKEIKLKEEKLEEEREKKREEFRKSNPYVPNQPINKDKFFR